jgi:predicted HAD superfamily Cof-like phosphohydrolase
VIEDNKAFLKKFGFDTEQMDNDKLQFRMDLLTEEFLETTAAMRDKNAGEWVDGHIDLLVIVLGNLNLAGIDVQKAWDEVHRANMSKERGTKKGREQSSGFDVVKPEGWSGPIHKGNHGVLDGIW